MFTSENGFSVIELLIAMAIVGIILTGVYNMAISSSRIHLTQTGIVQMQSDARTAMDFMVRELRLATANPIISSSMTTNDTINFNRVEDAGYSTGGGKTTFNDATKQWQNNVYAQTSTSAFTVSIISGTGALQARTITGNTATQLTVSPGWGVTPDTSSRYILTSNKGFTRTSGTDNILRYRIGATGQNNPLAENITSHSFSQPSARTLTITLSSRTSGLDPITKQYRYYTLTESVRLRN
jgi:prepilin-type N-terminal cleavage/methylation domain-containing protein